MNRAYTWPPLVPRQSNHVTRNWSLPRAALGRAAGAPGAVSPKMPAPRGAPVELTKRANEVFAPPGVA